MTEYESPMFVSPEGSNGIECLACGICGICAIDPLAFLEATEAIHMWMD